MAIDLRAAFENEPPTLDFIWPGFLAGTVGALVAPGATGKSFWALEAAMSVACAATVENRAAGGDLVGLAPAKAGRVVYYAGEDPEPALIGRIHSVGKHLGQEAREAIIENLMVMPIMGKLMDVTKKSKRAQIIEQCEGARLIVLDTLSRIHTLDENSNGDMARLVAMLEEVATITKASVLYLHHVSKGSARDGQADQQQAVRGASALVDNPRWCGFVAKMTDKEAQNHTDRVYDRQPIGENRRKFFVRFGVSKQNYAEIDDDRWYQRHDGGVLLPVELAAVTKERTLHVVSGSDDERW
ncbi:AAA family ATPase [Klebsiella pneumoniae]|uniref:helicase RepA family protein n=1 Tax=Klebsiella TaxID=570 RepID=UPI000A269D73|nr:MULTISPECIES: helicase RepA family protein [Klebsiella]HBR7302563.1 AAA family ATPase [Klebsiella aerogenes]EIV3905764.1 AAA family ATPase [Klebsiella pneumoniae]EIV3928068.1 AAA family ATPase [Klebsiella pneumoniae]EKT8156450.1 AAA family ATPase [Klebsiella pneumoniae]EKT8203151.1 AAA family ATPase [Klebsiella pneumoniae]